MFLVVDRPKDQVTQRPVHSRVKVRVDVFSNYFFSGGHLKHPSEGPSMIRVLPLGNRCAPLMKELKKL